MSLKAVIQKPLSLFVTTTCPFCVNARKLAANNGVNAQVVELDRVPEGGEIRKDLTELTKQRTVPYVFSKGEFIGGYSDLSQKDSSFWNKLK